MFDDLYSAKTMILCEAIFLVTSPTNIALSKWPWKASALTDSIFCKLNAVPREIASLLRLVGAVDEWKTFFKASGHFFLQS